MFNEQSNHLNKSLIYVNAPVKSVRLRRDRTVVVSGNAVMIDRC